MVLVIEYSQDMCGNYGFQTVFDGIYEQIKYHYRNVCFIRKYNSVVPYSGAGSPYSSFTLKIINPKNKKTVVLSFWDRGLDILSGWDNYIIVHLIGGLGMYLSSEELLKQYNIKHTPFFYPLGLKECYDFIEELRTPYNYEEKIKQAVFIGVDYEPRKSISKVLNKHPLFNIIPHNSERYLYGKPYYEEVNKYAISLSFNGNGEFSHRDFESFGLGIPVVRSELLTQFHEPLIPDKHYIVGTVPALKADMWYPTHTNNEIAEQYINKVEELMDNSELLTELSNNGIKYFENYLYPDKMIDKFFEIFDITLLEN